MATHSAPTYNYRRRETDSGAFFKVAAVLLASWSPSSASSPS